MITTVIFTAVCFLILAYIFVPFRKPMRAWLGTSSEDEESVASLEAKKDSLLRAIKDIDFEYASKKINDEDYRDLKNHYSLKAAEIIKKLENVQDVNTDKNRGK